MKPDPFDLAIARIDLDEADALPGILEARARAPAGDARSRPRRTPQRIAQYLSVGELHVMKHKSRPPACRDRLARRTHRRSCRRSSPTNVPERTTRHDHSPDHRPGLDPPDRVPRRTWLAFAVLILGVAMALLDTTIVNVALPVIRESLDADEATLSWIISGYALAYGLALIPAGRIGDRIGHKPVFIVGLIIFTARQPVGGSRERLHRR